MIWDKLVLKDKKAFKNWLSISSFKKKKNNYFYTLRIKKEVGYFF